jgi:putative transposase
MDGIMPRRARIALRGITQHVIQRGNNRGKCFFSQGDYHRYLAFLRELAPEFGCAIHAFVLMTNHVHMLITPARDDGTSLLMKNLGQRYVQYVNRIHGRTGTLWEGRFRSCLAQSERYVMVCHRYIELNPVRAGLVPHPGEYTWSSYGFNAEGVDSSLLTPHPLYLALGRTAAERQTLYRRQFAEVMDPELLHEIRSATNGNSALGQDDFHQQVSRALGRPVKRLKRGRPFKEE